VKLEAQGSTIYRGDEVVSTRRLNRLAAALGTESAEQTARLVPFFGPTMAGETHVVDILGLDLNRALLGGLSYEWARPFREGETVRAEVVVARVFDKGSNRFGVVVAEFSDGEGALIQRQSATFIEREQA
jgi:acyl dehydratase